MKNTILILISLLFITGCMEEKEVSSLQDRNGIKYEINSEVGFTGRLVEKYDNGQKYKQGNYKDGKKEGLDTWWDENGKKKSEGNFKGGELDGLVTIWDDNGQKVPKEVVKFLHADQELLDCRFESEWTDSSYELDIGMSLRIDPVMNKVCCHKITITIDSGEQIRVCPME